MPSSIKAIDTRVYESAEEVAPKVRQANIIHQRRKDLVSQIQLSPSPADSDAAGEAMPNVSALTMEEQRITRPVDRGSPGDQAIFSDTKTLEQRELSRRKSQYYGDVFAYREPISSARERISRESMIMADVRTNVIVCNDSSNMWTC
jgi:hypothetical protein